MRQLELYAYAKITLSLDIIRRYQDGYHEIESVMQQIRLGDRISIRETKNGEIQISTNNSSLPLDQKNLVWKAISLLRAQYKINQGTNVFIDKAIPIEGGLAGGSADAASVLVGLNTLWNLGLTKADLINLGTKIGYDVCFCIVGGTALVTGKGEIVTPIRTGLKLPFLVANPGFGISTKKAYQGLNPKVFGIRSTSNEMVKAISSMNVQGVIKNLHNDFETLILYNYPKIKNLKSQIQSKGALGVLLSGSGSSVFGIMGSMKQANTVAKLLRDDGIYAWSVWSRLVY